ncbi:hypothetical protein CR513_06477, partial [Mucuna pruriens]
MEGRRVTFGIRNFLELITLAPMPLTRAKFGWMKWSKLDVRHRIDVMHVKKNGKIKDGENASLDLIKMSIWQ